MTLDQGARNGPGGWGRSLALLLASALGSCTVSAPNPSTSAAREKQTPAAQPSTNVEASAAQDVRPTPSPPSPASDQRLPLPSNAAFLRAPLPPRSLDRYASWREIRRIHVGQSHLTEVDRLPSGQLVALSQAEGKVRVYDSNSGRLMSGHDVPDFQQFDRVALVAWPNTPDRFVLGTQSGLHVFDATSGALLETPDEAPVSGLRWSSDTNILMTVGPGPTEGATVLRFYSRTEAGGLERLGELGFAERIDAFDSSADGRLLAVVDYPSETLRVLDLERGREVHRRAAPRYAGDVDFSPDGRFLAVAGDGLLVVDLVNPERIAFYSFIKNNMGYVRFSPSGDAVVASSYDGKLRIFGLERQPSGAVSLELLKELSHAGDANVYAFSFSPDGSELVSVSGDQTLRAFSGQVRPNRSATQAVRGKPTLDQRFHDLDEWRQLDPPSPIPPPPLHASGRPAFASEIGPARPARLQPGRYACKITRIYRLRDCWVRRDAEGRTRLEFAADNLLHLAAIVWDDGDILRFEGRLLTPSPVIDCPGCDLQPLLGVLRGERGKYTGLLTFRRYYDPYVPPPAPPSNVRIEEANDRFPVVLEYVGPLDEGR